MEEQVTAKTKSEDEQFEEMMDPCFVRWDNGKNMKVTELRSKALEAFANSEMNNVANFSADDLSDKYSFVDKYGENKFYGMDEDVLYPNFCERHNNSESFEQTTKNQLTVQKPCSYRLITCEYFKSNFFSRTLQMDRYWQRSYDAF